MRLKKTSIAEKGVSNKSFRQKSNTFLAQYGSSTRLTVLDVLKLEAADDAYSLRCAYPILANLLIISKSNSVFVSCSAASSLEIKTPRYWMPARRIYSGGRVTKKKVYKAIFKKFF